MMQSEFQFTNPALLSLNYEINKNFSSNDPVMIDVKTSTDIRKSKNSREAFVVLSIEIGESSDKMPFHLTAEEGASFRWPQGKISDANIDALLRQNAPALLLSYLRPTIAMVTAASQFASYNIPFMNFANSSSVDKKSE